MEALFQKANDHEIIFVPACENIFFSILSWLDVVWILFLAEHCGSVKAVIGYLLPSIDSLSFFGTVLDNNVKNHNERMQN